MKRWNHLVLMPVLVALGSAAIISAGIISAVIISAGAGATASAQASVAELDGLIATDGANSTAAARLIDGTTGTFDSDSWENAGNRWSNDSFPMTMTIDVGAVTLIDSVQLFVGQVPFPATAQLDIATSTTGTAGSFTSITTLTAPTYDAWSDQLVIGEQARFVELSFANVLAHFNVAEVAVYGGDVTPTNLIDGVIASDVANSEHADRLVDNAIGPDPADSWWNPAIWQPTGYPMVAELDLGATYSLASVEYFVGNLNQGTDELLVEYSAQETGDDFEPLHTVQGSAWNDWNDEDASGEVARRLRLSFANQSARFNLAEVRVYGTETTPVATVTPTATPTPVVPPTPTPTATPAITAPTVTPTATPTPVVDGPTPTPTPTPSPTPTPTPTAAQDQPRTSPPGADIVRSFGFDDWPKGHLSTACADLHDSYWVQGPNAGVSDDPNHPDNLAYHTWHPALAVSADGLVCDFGHEHGTNPLAAGPEAFDYSGGWPAFGYVSEHAAVGGAMRHEDHVGHKITVATFRAAIGNGANRNDTLYDAGFECIWLSKIHQGSHSMDAFANHLHEYMLTVLCGDGTEFSVKVMFTYGEPNKFVEESCSQDVPWTPWNDTVFDSHILTGPDGGGAHAHQTSPVGNNSPNNRAFTCSSGVIWQDMETTVEVVDIWNELIKIKRNDDSTALTIQPYYIVKNPARIIEAYDGIKSADGEQQNFDKPSQVVRTISICYGDDGQRLNRLYCKDAPLTEPDWDDPASPFNGTFRAIHFKSSDLRNSGGPEAWCTDPYGHAISDELPCDAGSIEQRAASYTNHWNDGQFSNGGNSGNVAGSIWSSTPQGAYIEAEPRPGGGYFGYRIGYELIIDNRDPDDDFDGVPDGATIRGQN